jgi:hypothetical protein
MKLTRAKKTETKTKVKKVLNEGNRKTKQKKGVKAIKKLKTNQQPCLLVPSKLR